MAAAAAANMRRAAVLGGGGRNYLIIDEGPRVRAKYSKRAAPYAPQSTALLYLGERSRLRTVFATTGIFTCGMRPPRPRSPVTARRRGPRRRSSPPAGASGTPARSGPRRAALALMLLFASTLSGLPPGAWRPQPSGPSPPSPQQKQQQQQLLLLLLLLLFLLLLAGAAARCPPPPSPRASPLNSKRPLPPPFDLLPPLQQTPWLRRASRLPFPLLLGRPWRTARSPCACARL